MKTKLLSFAAAFAAAAAFADPNDPQITKIADATQGGNRVVVVNYRLDEPAIVTFDVKTNGVSIGAANLKYASGDVHKVVAAGDHVLNWNAWKAWPGYKFDDGSVSIEVKAWATNSPPDYMVIDLRKGANGEYATGAKTYYTGPEQLPDTPNGDVIEKGGVTNNAYKTDYLVMRRIYAKNIVWPMSSPSGEEGRQNDATANTGENSQHYVQLTNDYYIAVFPGTIGHSRALFSNGRGSSAALANWFPTDGCAYTHLNGASARTGGQPPDSGS